MTGYDLYFEDVVVGSEFVSGERLVTEHDLTAFAEISGDHHPIHVDPDFAAGSVFGQRILHGPFGIAVVLGLFGQFRSFGTAAVALTDIRDWRFRAPIFVGDRLTLRMRIGAKSAGKAGRRGIVQRDMSLVKQDGGVVQDGQMGLLMACRAATPEM
ncbi:Acyl dehydratase [Methylobacterium sp. ap11]|uniref:MaoC/PaaZ C-terminal domain-containing protein n=1 Tax=Methylobacterium sp. ap11 TaxID=1761799 RepID=UPI0008B885FD|nr:MaoC/PaaZ C-terminal domain-containing protein [Methylobacterium sp. ap11]SEP28484.1 Acyl dehydratase [Methylobacterium sp. ap11]